MKKILIFLFAIAAISACNSGFSNQVSQDAKTALNTGHQAKAADMSGIWNAPFIIQTSANGVRGGAHQAVDQYFDFPHGHLNYSQYVPTVTTATQYNKVLQFKQDIFSPALATGVTVVSVKPCYIEINGGEGALPYFDGWVNVALTSDNHVYLSSGGGGSKTILSDIHNWYSLKFTSSAMDKVNLNSLACYVEDLGEIGGKVTHAMQIMVVGGVKSSDVVKPFVARGYATYHQDIINDRGGKQLVFSWVTLGTMNTEGKEHKDYALNDVAVGNSSEVSGQIKPTFLAVGQNGVNMLVGFNNHNISSPIYSTVMGSDKTKTMDWYSVAHRPEEQDFIVGGMHYFFSTNGLKHSTVFPIGTVAAATTHIIPDERQNPDTIGRLGITSIGCLKAACAIALKTLTADSGVRVSSFILGGKSMVKGGLIDYKAATIDSNLKINMIDPQIYADPWLGVFYLLGVEGSQSKIYYYEYGSAGKFQDFIGRMPILK